MLGTCIKYLFVLVTLLCSVCGLWTHVVDTHVHTHDFSEHGLGTRLGINKTFPYCITLEHSELVWNEKYAGSIRNCCGLHGAWYNA